MVLKWFYSLNRQKTFVGGKCNLPSALLVIILVVLTDVEMFHSKTFTGCCLLHAGFFSCHWMSLPFAVLKLHLCWRWLHTTQRDVFSVGASLGHTGKFSITGDNCYPSSSCVQEIKCIIFVLPQTDSDILLFITGVCNFCTRFTALFVTMQQYGKTIVQLPSDSLATCGTVRICFSI